MASFTTTTRILSFFAFWCELAPLLFKLHGAVQNFNKKGKTKGIVVVVVKWRHNENGLKNFFEDARKQLEKLSLNFSSCNPFPSWPSAAKYTR